MSDALQPNDALLTAINNLFEHPDAIQILLGNETLNAAISNYINAAAERLKPESQWKEVWLQVSEPRNFTYEDAWDKNDIVIMKVVARVAVRYSEGERVAHLFAMIKPSDPYFGRVLIGDGLRDRLILLDTSMVADHYGAAIEWGQSLWVEAARLFEERTTPLSEGGAT